MQIPHNALVLIADGRKMLLFRNEGDATHLNLQVEQKEIHDNPKNRDQKTDAAGGASSTQTGAGAPPIAQGGSMHAQGQGAQFAPSRGTMEETDFHQLEEDRFAADIAEILRLKALNNAFQTLIIAAPARTLGELRKHYHKEVESRLSHEIAKDLTNHPVAQIEDVLQAT